MAPSGIEPRTILESQLQSQFNLNLAVPTEILGIQVAMQVYDAAMRFVIFVRFVAGVAC